MKKLLVTLLIILIVILVVLIGLGIYAYTYIKPFLSDGSGLPMDFLEQQIDGITTPTGDRHPLLDESQEATLEKLGVDPAKLPTEITPEMESCFVDKLGSDRVGDIVGGETPGVLDFIKAKSCIE
jgi:hypothetical protein